MGTAVVILADDLTGACDAAAPFAAAGRRARVLLEPQRAHQGMDVVAYDLHVRDCSPEETGARARHAAQRWSSSSARLFVKIDSTLRGPLVEFCRAALEGAEHSVAVIAPAFPAQGRALLNGRLTLAGTAVAGEDADLLGRVARTGEPLVHVPLARVSTRVVEQAIARASAEKIRMVIVDAQIDVQLESVAQAIANCAARVLIAGSGGIAHAMAGLSPTACAPRKTRSPSGPIVVFVGSPALATRRQVNQLSRQPHTHVVRLPGFAERFPTRLGDGEVLVVATCPGDEFATIVRDDAASAQLLARYAVLIAAQARPRAVVLVGGTSARAVCLALGVHALDLDGEAAPGLPCGVFRGGLWNDVRVMTKSGGFGGPALLCDAVQACQTREEPA